MSVTQPCSTPSGTVTLLAGHSGLLGIAKLLWSVEGTFKFIADFPWVGYVQGTAGFRGRVALAAPQNPTGAQMLGVQWFFPVGTQRTLERPGGQGGQGRWLEVEGRDSTQPWLPSTPCSTPLPAPRHLGFPLVSAPVPCLLIAIVPQRKTDMFSV
jgi:hypothetical protein